MLLVSFSSSLQTSLLSAFKTQVIINESYPVLLFKRIYCFITQAVLLLWQMSTLLTVIMSFSVYNGVDLLCLSKSFEDQLHCSQLRGKESDSVELNNRLASYSNNSNMVNILLLTSQHHPIETRDYGD